MNKLWRLLPALVLLLPIAAASRTMPGQPGTILSQGQEPAIQAMQGELVKVDLENGNFTIKLENEQEVQFQFDSNTSVEGKENGIQGLSAETGTRLVVRYKETEGKKLATRIEIKKIETW